MKISVYAVRLAKGWKLEVSLDLRVDMWWWIKGGALAVEQTNSKQETRGIERINREKSTRDIEHRKIREVGNYGQDVKGMILLSNSMPLGWAITLCEGFTHQANMDNWTLDDWTSYMRIGLKEELALERKAQGDGGRSERELKGRGRVVVGRVPIVTERDLVIMDRPSWLWVREKGLSPLGVSLIGREVGDYGYRISSSKLELGDDLREWDIAFAEADWLASAMEGRSLLEAELQQLLAETAPRLVPAAWRSAAQLAHLQGRVQFTAGVAPATARLGQAPRLLSRRLARAPRCRRCGSEVHRRTPCGSCGSNSCAYCEACLALGRSRSCALLLRGSARAIVTPAGGDTAGSTPTESLLDRWGLSPAQRMAAGAALSFLAEPQEVGNSARAQRGAGLLRRAALRARQALRGGGSATATEESQPQKPRSFLLWAVTGAGKTEMIFPLLRYVLDQGGRALIATPRRDVVLELAPRLAAAFPEEKIAVLYGGSSQRWGEAQLFLATTHQLLRFYRSFDLVIIDELDAFPYHNDPMLAYAAERCCKLEGRFVFLSATPPAALQREIAAGRLPHAKVPARFHGHPLPLPAHITMKRVEDCLHRKSIGASLTRYLQVSISRGAQIFVFVSRIRHIMPLVALLRLRFPGLAIDGTSSQDEERASKVLAFRSGEIRMLITTTILERGVTVPRSDVYILDADSGLFDEASLVQMAGRAGRSKNDPAGMVVFASPEWSKSQRGARHQIKSMNMIARKNGFLRESKGGSGR
ncbi:DEAD/DEAH box helicase [Paenibacillus anaericanus]|uniref:DEAD/DEAH box helicase n=1 Tax=Paenibacillus anaericanus TaxID=170367 RepID=UPI0035227811